MRGHESLIALRRQGVSPTTVFIDVDFPPSDWPTLWRDEFLAGQQRHAKVEIGAGEMLSSLDFRFCVGLFVLVHGVREIRVRTVAEACADAGAKHVIAAAGASVLALPAREAACA